MPRGRKKKTGDINELIAATEVEIESLSEQLEAKKQALADLKIQKEAEDKEKLIAMIQSSGLDVEEATAAIQNAVAAKVAEGVSSGASAQHEETEEPATE